jgi:protein involved in sex pheromone biosynthesis
MDAKDLKTVQNMEQYGGSFVKALAEAFHKADSENFLKLKNAFPEYWQKYSKMK